MPVRLAHTILKLSGELFSEKDTHISFPGYDKVSKQIIEITKATGAPLCIVVGAGNIMRGRDASPTVDRNEADSMGMLATIINGIGLREALVRNGASDTRLMTSIPLTAFAEPYIRLKAKHHLANGRIVIIAGGLGRPKFSTDSAVAQFASELDCNMIFKASTVDGVYDKDPHKNKDAVRYTDITYQEAIVQSLGVMDKTAFAMCMESEIPIFVFNINNLDRLPDAINSDYSFGTLIHK